MSPATESPSCLNVLLSFTIAVVSANHRPNDLSDLRKWDADLLLVCRNCKRRGILELLPIIIHFRSRGCSTAWGNIACRFRCKGTRNDPGCGSKDVSAQMAPRLKPPAPVPRKSELALRQQARRERH